jgi:hypothetical protein
LLTIG